MKIIMLKGLPGSGKSTWAKAKQKEGSFIRISKDDIRPMLGGYKARREKDVVRIRNRLIEEAIGIRRNVIIDDTNLNPVHERSIAGLAKKLGAKFEVNDEFLKVPPEVCIERDLHRGEKAVGAGVIWDMFYTWLCPQNLKYLDKSFEKPRCVIVDVDGTLAINTSGRSFYDLIQVSKDTPDPFISCVVDALYNYGHEQSGQPYPKIIIVSGREETCREDTEQWLARNMIPYDELLMRKEGDSRPDAEIKREIYDTFLKDRYAVLGVIDDRPIVCRMWRSLGLRVAQVGNPYLEF